MTQSASVFRLGKKMKTLNQINSALNMQLTYKLVTALYTLLSATRH